MRTGSPSKHAVWVIAGILWFGCGSTSDDTQSADSGTGSTSELDGGAQGNDDGQPGDGSATDPDASTPQDAGVDAATPDAGPLPPAYLGLFDPDVIPTFRITLTAEQMAALELDPYTYQEGSFSHDGTTLERVGIRLKGRASAQGFDGKPALKLKFNEFVSGQRYQGLKRLTLNNMTQDPTVSHERIGFALYRAAGVPAPLCNHAIVYINDVYYGLYLNLQTLDEVFVEERFPGDAVGNLYDITNDEYFIDFERGEEPEPSQESKFELETNKEMPDKSDLTALIHAASETSDAEWLSAIEAQMNLDEVLTLGAVQAVIADWDGYFGARNNYKLYRDLASDRFVMFPWGIDQTFNLGQVTYALDHSESDRPQGIVGTRCFQNPTCLARYQDKLREVVTVFESVPLADMVDAIIEQTAEALATDTRTGYSEEDRVREVAFLHDFLAQRAAIVRDALPVAP